MPEVRRTADTDGGAYLHPALLPRTHSQRIIIQALQTDGQITNIYFLCYVLYVCMYKRLLQTLGLY